MSTLAGRLVVLTVTVALTSTLVTGAVLLGQQGSLVRQGAVDDLARDARSLAAVADSQPFARGRGTDGVATRALQRLLARGEVTSAVVVAGQAPVAPFTAADVSAVLAQGSVSTSRTVDRQEWLVAGQAASDRAALVAQPVASAGEVTPAQRRRLTLALLLGLAGGALAGLALARGLARPLQQVAAAARRMSRGDRTVTVATSGPAEIADVAVALNDLGAALTHSEQRQQRFLLSVSHELRTPLTAIAGYTEALADGVLAPADVPAAAEVIQTEAARMRHRVEDLLALARLEADDFTLSTAAVDLSALAASAVAAWAPRALDRGLDLRVETAGPVVVRTDAERVRQALDALLDNAVRVVDPGTPVVVAVQERAGEAVLSVRDGGPGIAPEDLASAFERGRLAERYRGERPVGSGIGLALVASLVQRLGGRVAAEAAAEGGLAVHLTLPRPGGGDQVRPVPPHLVPAPPGPRRT